jgi:hypothetical protein
MQYRPNILRSTGLYAKAGTVIELTFPFNMVAMLSNIYLALP